MNILQAIVNVSVYPAVPIDYFCVPQPGTPGHYYATQQRLHEDVIFSPEYREKQRWTEIATSIEGSWIPLLVAIVCPILLSLLYVQFMSMAAGLVMIISLCVTTILMGGLSVFFLLAIFDWNAQDEKAIGGYNVFNPLIHSDMEGGLAWPTSLLGTNGKFLSILVGWIFAAFTVCLVISTFRQVPEIDKMIGFVTMACECILDCCHQSFPPKQPGGIGNCLCGLIPFVGCKSPPLLTEAFMMSFWLLIQLMFCSAGLFLMITTGYVDHNTLIINGQPTHSMYAEFKWCEPFGIPWKYFVGFYVFMCYWLYEIQMARYEYCVTSGISHWYLSDSVTVQMPAVAGAVRGKEIHGMRVAGIDSAPPNRQGMRYTAVGEQHRDVVITAAGYRGPGDKDIAGPRIKKVEFYGGQYPEKQIPSGWSMCSTFYESLRYYTGTLAFGSLVVAFTRPLRLIATVIRALTGGKSEDRQLDEPQSLGDSIYQFLMLVVNLIEHAVACYSKSCYAGVVLSGYGFLNATRECKILLEEAGGTIAYLHGCFSLFELVGVAGITSISTIVSWIVLHASNANPGSEPKYLIDLEKQFGNPDLKFLPMGMYIRDTQTITLLCCLISFMITYSYMVLYSLAIDVIMYNVAFCRKLQLKTDDNKAVNGVCCPGILKGIMKSELDDNLDDLGVLADVRAHHHVVNHHQFHHALKTATSTVKAHATGNFPERAPLMSTGR
jgi:hypothetical protein